MVENRRIETETERVCNICLSIFIVPLAATSARLCVVSEFSYRIGCFCSRIKIEIGISVSADFGIIFRIFAKFQEFT